MLSLNTQLIYSRNVSHSKKQVWLDLIEINAFKFGTTDAIFKLNKSLSPCIVLYSDQSLQVKQLLGIANCII